ncbi:MAG: thiol:disulfide interchange protein DsbA/DsbL [Acidiferrobacterales bacterium]|nr:thiol:disulfide interchange protein DsbA/DsbL [Acidiferrobacterales bacterium]
MINTFQSNGSKFSKFWLSALISLLLCQSISAQDLDESKYTELATPLSVSTGDQIEVAELFWYGCSHCYALESYVRSWLENKPENAEFVKTPAIFSSSWAFHAQAFYTMEALGVLEEANDAFFHQIHVIRKPISTLEALTSFLSKYDKSEDEVNAAFNSFAVDTKLRNANKVTRQSGATGVPAILVDGKYLTSVSQAGGQTELFKVIDQLVEKAAMAR